jgi:hypothetical protein
VQPAAVFEGWAACRPWAQRLASLPPVAVGLLAAPGVATLPSLSPVARLQAGRLVVGRAIAAVVLPSGGFA